MGLQVRKRTKGKNSWWNGSYSEKGVGVSGSGKLSSNVTINTGDLINGKTPSRVTVNLGGGVRYVAYGKRKTTPSTRPKASDPVTTVVQAIFGLFFVLVVLMIFISFIAILIGS